MLDQKSVVLLGVAALALVLVIVFYLGWTRIAGLPPTVAKRASKLSWPLRVSLALTTGTLLGVGIVAAPNQPAGIAALTLLAASTFSALILFELAQHKDELFK